MTRRRVARWLHASRRADAAATARHDRLARDLLAAASSGDGRGIQRLLRADAELIVDGGGLVAAPVGPLRGRDDVAAYLIHVLGDGKALAVEPVNGLPGLVIRRSERRRVVGVLCFRAGRAGIEEAWLVLNPDKLAHWDAR
ncbi:siderophore-interacting protein [Microbacterium sulfonylureivorans]|uniref:siderophore-interacting protein n=1 Tax=Microbacterium sulfonylureivorans TaxID=2486854 RepID=UPI000FDCC122|nr:siderophore-interacting protein [Microbacterium sulfonylureivorans]